MIRGIDELQEDTRMRGGDRMEMMLRMTKTEKNDRPCYPQGVSMSGINESQRTREERGEND